MGKKIEVFTAFIHKDSEGQEGLIAEMIGNQWMPFVAADPERTLELYHLAKKMDVEFRIVRFSKREDITDEIEKMVNPETYVGLSIGHANIRAKSYGLASRVTQLDGAGCIVTHDYKLARLNFHVDNGIVTHCNTG